MGLHVFYHGLVQGYGHWLVLGVREAQVGRVDPSLQGFPVGLGVLREKEERRITGMMETACHSLKMKRFPLKMTTIVDVMKGG